MKDLSLTASILSRLNTSDSKSSLDCWKQRKAERYNFEDIIARIGFSGVLSIDEYKREGYFKIPLP